MPRRMKDTIVSLKTFLLGSCKFVIKLSDFSANSLEDGILRMDWTEWGCKHEPYRFFMFNGFVIRVCEVQHVGKRATPP